MKNSNVIPLSKLASGQSGQIVGFSGGWGVKRRVQAMGIRPGKRITKVSGMFMRGPVVVKVDNVQVAVGWGMAQKIMVRIGGDE
jgi:ferrous iron transport protein A